MATAPELENLVKVEGKSFEDVVALLEKNNVEYNINIQPSTRCGYFRYSTIWVSEEDFQKIKESSEFGVTGTSPKALRIEGLYRIEKGFDARSLHGNITFRKGQLVESTNIWYERKG